MNARLVFLGQAPASAPIQDTPICVSRLTSPPRIVVGTAIALEIKHPSRWSRKDVTRVIVGSNPDRADVLLVDEPLSIIGEHIRFYLNQTDPTASELRPMNHASVSVNGKRLQDLQWAGLQHDDEIQLGAWRFRYEIL
jgi:hypothetical protein